MNEEVYNSEILLIQFLDSTLFVNSIKESDLVPVTLEVIGRFLKEDDNGIYISTFYPTSRSIFTEGNNTINFIPKKTIIKRTILKEVKENDYIK